MPALLFSFSPDSYELAVREIREEFGRDVEIERVSANLGRLVANAPPVGELAAACDDGRIIFVRHLTVEIAGFPPDDVPPGHELAELVLAELPRHPQRLAVQTWTDGAGSGGTFYHLLEDALGARGVEVSRSGQEIVVSCFVSGRAVLVGLNRLEHSLADWPGGRMRLARSDERVSRSEFKLEEAIQTFRLDLRPGGRALDLGASPGGWTRILRQYEQEVWSVDPGALDPRLDTDRRIHHVATTAGEFFRRNQVRFDAVVNDMRMDQVMSARVMLDAVPHLRRGALAVVTLKGGGRNPLDAARRGMDVLSKEYDVLHARQLHHNRREITVVARAR
ncbi:ribosomal RNA methyltransferase RrmJ/FtsJ [Kribbella flavida DSM 17836]|uniref:Ribosomal RNA methyltransferase RrmJ/FtsJ n=1 Tax=Kribbella flavida (strain DSM 17836 / JCM 10339 / NBRC 14399) TaxID=479435 RepID=D2Q0M8_KRIFD|nr:SAM-dependent methyltransferase [Kribbella flavida]ADB33828.1 ribosomal RNA methyltransferase RrmJ/FtsJ [Kribbella flavida DSM 17836]